MGGVRDTAATPEKPQDSCEICCQIRSGERGSEGARPGGVGLAEVAL